MAPTNTIQIKDAIDVPIAILVGNFNYDNLGSLIAPKYDSKKLAELLIDKEIGNYKCSLVLDKHAKYIKFDIEKVLKSIEKNDVFLLYYSGHGIKIGEKFYLTAKPGGFAPGKRFVHPAESRGCC